MNKPIIKSWDETLNPCLDPIFKAIFTSETPESQAALKDFISTYTEQKVVEVMVSSNEPAVTGIDDKQIRFDVNCVFNDGQRANVEMTISPTLDELIRLEHYVSVLFTRQETRGVSQWRNLKHAYQISIIVNEPIVKDDHFIHVFEYYDKENGATLGGRTHIITIELAKFKDIVNKNLKNVSPKEYWAVFFKCIKEKTNLELVNSIIQKEEGIAMATRTLLKISKDEEMQFKAMSEEKRRNDWEKDLNSREYKKALEIAENFLKLGLTPEQISKGTGLDVSEIEELKEEI
jgi:predicted transposase/invertase (TIGR01784 family)